MSPKWRSVSSPRVVGDVPLDITFDGKINSASHEDTATRVSDMTCARNNKRANGVLLRATVTGKGSNKRLLTGVKVSRGGVSSEA